MNKGKLITQLKEQIEKIDKLRFPPAFNPKYKIWKNTTIKVLNELFGGDYVELFTSEAKLKFLASSPSKRYLKFENILNNLKQLLEGFLEENDELSESEISVSKKFRLEDYELHKKIVKVSGKLFDDGHYKDAIFKAYIEVIDRVKGVAGTPTKSNGREMDGDSLMNHVFNSENPIIKLNNLEVDADTDEQRGFMYLFKGICGLRNKKGHKNFVQNDPKRTIEHLALASLLMGLLDDDFIAEYNG